ncbi:hypothetical protein GO290_02741 [Ralstonia solanacearum]|nr:hypothetical protein [Ralstonia solanacearum]BCN13367.1 hypothetical protein RPSD_52520 [Ralstonia solanacearum]
MKNQSTLGDKLTDEQRVAVATHINARMHWHLFCKRVLLALPLLGVAVYFLLPAIATDLHENDGLSFWVRLLAIVVCVAAAFAMGVYGYLVRTTERAMRDAGISDAYIKELASVPDREIAKLL